MLLTFQLVLYSQQREPSQIPFIKSLRINYWIIYIGNGINNINNYSIFQYA